MNETTTTRSDLSEHEQLFGDVIIEIVKGKHKGYERDREKLGEDIPLENIHFGIEDFKACPDKMRGIRRDMEPESTAKWMLWSLCNRNEIKSDNPGRYRLTKHGFLYKRLTEKLASTP